MGDVAVAAVGIDERARTIAAQHAHVGRGAHVARGDRVGVLDQAQDPVAGHAAQLGGDEAVGGQRRVVLGHADRLQHAGRERPDDRGVHQARVIRAGRRTVAAASATRTATTSTAGQEPIAWPSGWEIDEQRERHDEQHGGRAPARDRRRDARAPEAACDEHEAAQRADAGELGDAERDEERQGGDEGQGAAGVHAAHRSRWA